MQRASQWWKCDLQIATPPFNFNAGAHNYDWADPADCRRFADSYVDSMVTKGIQLVALANHNRADEWIDYMRDAGRERDVVVLPGVEITSGTGADGVHLILIADEDCSATDIDRFLHGPCGFGGDNPLFLDNGDPAPSPRTADQILDAMDDRFLAIAPHALNDNGIASAQSVKGSIRWKVLHHPRLAAVDVGDPNGAATGTSFNQRFRNRELEDFPCLQWLPFLATSDAYTVDRAGERFSWIRMASRSLEGLRQALLDRETRTIASWDERLQDDPDPNAVSHAWISSIKFDRLGNSDSDVHVHFDPHLNVIVGGRGSGKSTIVNGLLQLYGDRRALPDDAASEVTSFAAEVLAGTSIEANHWLADTPLQQIARWDVSAGSRTERTEGVETPTEFAATIVCQKELFERSGPSRGASNTASRYLLKLVDGWASDGQINDFDTALDDKRDALANATYERLRVEKLKPELTVLDARIAELRAQIATLDDEAAAQRRQRNESLDASGKHLDQAFDSCQSSIKGLREEIPLRLPRASSLSQEDEALAKELQPIDDLVSTLIDDLALRLDVALAEVSDLATKAKNSDFSNSVRAARDDLQAYLAELADAGLDPAAYQRLAAELAIATENHANLAERLEQTDRLTTLESEAGEAVQLLLNDRRSERKRVMEEAEAPELLRFEIEPAADSAGWAQVLRDRMSLRSDGFLSEVAQLAKWVAASQSNLLTWQEALRTNSYRRVEAAVNLRGQFWTRLGELDERTRLRMSAEEPDDVATMFFRRDGLDPSDPNAWQPVDSGSPGERTAAMLTLVLAHGSEPLVLDQPEDDLDTEWISQLVVQELRRVRWNRQLIVVTHNANIPVNGDADRVIVMENRERSLRVREDGPVEVDSVRHAIQDILEGGVAAFVAREKRYNNELSSFRLARGLLRERRHPEAT